MFVMPLQESNFDGEIVARISSNQTSFYIVLGKDDDDNNYYLMNNAEELIMVPLKETLALVDCEYLDDDLLDELQVAFERNHCRPAEIKKRRHVSSTRHSAGPTSGTEFS